MSALPSRSPVGAAYANYIAQGWALVPIASGKGPTTTGWNHRENCWTTPEQINDQIGVGIAHAYSQTCAIDIDDLPLAAQWLSERGINLDQLLDADDSVRIDSGNFNHAKLLFKLPHPLNSKKISVDGKTALEFRCATTNGLTVQDVLPSLAIHPKTGQHYKWAGKGHWQRLPMLPFNVSLVWQSLLIDEAPTKPKQEAVDLNEARQAMMAIDADCDRDTWIEVGMAWHSAGGDFASWNEWSATAKRKYPGERDLLKQWQSFKPDRSITIGTLYHHAYEAGWRKPAPDVSELFKDVSVVAPSEAIHGLRLKAPAPDLSVFPDVLQRRAMELSEHVGCDPIVPLFAGLTTISGAIDKRTRLELAHGYQVPPILWLMTVGHPGDKKTPGSKPMFNPLSALEHEDKPRFKDAMLMWEAMEAAHNADMKAFKEQSASVEAMLNDAPLQVRDLPPAPVPLRLMVGDVTSQKLVRMVADNPRGMLCYLDEMGSWVKKLTDPRSGDDRGCWLQAYEGGRYQMDRVLNGSTEAENMSVAIYGNIQPKVLQKNIPLMESDGLLQRFIPGVLRGELTGIGKPAPAAMFTSEAAWEALVRQTYALPVTTYKLSPEAALAFRGFQIWFERTRRDNRLLNVNDIYMTAFSKLEGTLGRMALVMHVMTAPYEMLVSERTMLNAIAFIREYIMPSMEYTYMEISGLFEASLEKWVLDYIIQNIGERTHLTLSDLRRAARRQVEGMTKPQAEQALRDAMYYVEDSGWARPIEETTRSVEWALNPIVAEIFGQQRKEVIKARQRAADYRREIVIKSGHYTERKLVKGYDPAWDDEEGI